MPYGVPILCCGLSFQGQRSANLCGGGTHRVCIQRPLFLGNPGLSFSPLLWVTGTALPADLMHSLCPHGSFVFCLNSLCCYFLCSLFILFHVCFCNVCLCACVHMYVHTFFLSIPSLTCVSWIWKNPCSSTLGVLWLSLTTVLYHSSHILDMCVASGSFNFPFMFSLPLWYMLRNFLKTFVVVIC